MEMIRTYNAVWLQNVDLTKLKVHAIVVRCVVVVVVVCVVVVVVVVVVVGLACWTGVLCFGTFPGDGTPVPKHVAVNTINYI
jgi:hypothetical protein